MVLQGQDWRLGGAWFRAAWSKEKREGVYIEMEGRHEEAWQKEEVDQAIEQS
jgi:hypothetical protein